MAREKRLRRADSLRARLFSFDTCAHGRLTINRVDTTPLPSTLRLEALPSDVKYVSTLLPRRQRTREDPLSDDVYKGFHRRMTKEERSMVGGDRNRMMVEIDTLREQLVLLGQHDWVRQLPRITVVNDITDMKEMTRKRSLTIGEINRILDKYARWERRNSRLYRDTRRFRDVSVSESDSDGEEVMGRLEKLREERERQRQEANAGVVRIVLGNGYDIVARGKEAEVVPSLGQLC